MSKPDKQPDIQQNNPDIEDQPVHPSVAKVLEYEPYLLTLEIEEDQVCTHLLGEMLRGNPQAEPQILELVKHVKQEGIDIKVGQLEASRRLRETGEAFKTFSKTDLIRVLYDNKFDPYQTEKTDNLQITVPRTRKPRTPMLQQPKPLEFTNHLKLKEQAIESVQEGLKIYMGNVAKEINEKVEAAMAIYPKNPPAPQTVSSTKFNLESWDPKTDGNIVIIQEKPCPKITLDTDAGNDKLSSRLQ